MSFIPKKPEKAVQVLLARITKAEDHVKRMSNCSDHVELTSKFENMGSKLQLMTESMSKINNWEKKLVDQLHTLEELLHEGIFGFEGADLNKSGFPSKLEMIDANLSILTDLVSAVEQSLKTDMIGGRLPGEWSGVKLGIERMIMESEAMARLCKSYDRLECHRVRMCLLSLSVFPENTPIKKRPLIYWWMGEGIIGEQDGEQVFQRILKEGFMRRPTTTSDSSTSANSFIFNPWVRRMLIWLADKNGFLEFSSLQWTPLNRKRRAFDINNINEEADTLTVFNINDKYLRTEKQWLSRLHKVEVLQLGRWQDSSSHHIEAENYEALLAGLGSQKHLKYLSLRGISRIETLPSTIGKLVSLRILDLKACHNLGRIPGNISQLSQLTHLDMSQCYLLESMPKGLPHLLNLQVLKGFVVSSDGCSIAHLSPLQHLRKLSLRVRNQGCHQLSSLVHLKGLRILTISWMGMAVDPATPVKLPTTLTKLDLRSVPFEAVPDWMKPDQLPHLEKLYIKGGKLMHHCIEKIVYPKLIHSPRLKHLPLHINQQE